jgi:hypothetical protein
MITREGFIQSTGLEPEKAEKLYNQLEERFDGDWKKAAEYLKDVVAYLKKHQN